MNTVTAQAPRTLIADDQPDVLAALRLLLKGNGYQTEAADSPAAVLNAIKQQKFDLLLMDLNYARDTTSGKEGLDLISRVHSLDSNLPIIVMTAWATVDLAVETMRLGVRDFVQKPWENSRLLQKLRVQIQQGRELRRRQEIEVRDRLELDEALEIQRGLISRRMPQLDGFSLASAWQPARAVSGDYLAAFKLDDSHAALCVADVAGKGFPAALLMSNLQAALKSLTSERISPSEICGKLNELMCGNTPLRKFVTCFYAELEVPTKKLKFTNAGHNPPFLMRRSGEYIRLEDGGPVIGAFQRSTFTEREIQLCEGDKLLLFTDGVTEARDESGEEFGEHRLEQCLQSYRGSNAAELRSLILREVTEFCGNHFDDDATLLAVIAD
ncbi:MAG TPA: SpoIIE family protein phosphatase [Pyrinomonadaceae bacterium]|nr:SpoIIE family protein phosphatase [Pyrinomonadaceae bacterium]